MYMCVCYMYMYMCMLYVYVCVHCVCLVGNVPSGATKVLPGAQSDIDSTDMNNNTAINIGADSDAGVHIQSDAGVHILMPILTLAKRTSLSVR